jgi:uncharacterized SAM-binding protein YcdF (DUF218 family)
MLLKSRRSFIVLAALCAAAVLSFLSLRHLGEWIELDDPLQHSRAIIVFGGGIPFRAMEAASLYHAGWAGEVWLTQGTPADRDIALAQIGLPETPEHEFSRSVLVKLGVPPQAIQVIPEPVDNTAAEVQAVMRYAQAGSGSPLILVTSKFHTRRVRVIWNAMAHGRAGGGVAILRYPPKEPFDAAHWWRTTTDAIVTFRETFGILNAWAGFPIAPRER